MTIIWADGDIANEWLQVTVLANNKTGLASDDVFYFGSIIGDTGNSTTDAIVDTLDIGRIRQNFSGFNTVPVTSLHDHNHDGRVHTLDIGVVRLNFTGFVPVNLITPNGSSSFAASKTKEKPVPVLPAPQLAVPLKRAQGSSLLKMSPRP